MSNEFNDPGTGGDQLPLKEIDGSLLLITVHEETDEIQTKYGPNTAIRADVAVLDGGRKGETYNDTLIFPRVLKAQLRHSAGGKVLGRLGHGEAKGGQDPPWTLTPANDKERETGRKYLSWLATQQPVAAPEPPDEEPF